MAILGMGMLTFTLIEQTWSFLQTLILEEICEKKSIKHEKKTNPGV